MSAGRPSDRMGDHGRTFWKDTLCAQHAGRLGGRSWQVSRVSGRLWQAGRVSGRCSFLLLSHFCEQIENSLSSCQAVLNIYYDSLLVRSLPSRPWINVIGLITCGCIRMYVSAYACSLGFARRGWHLAQLV